MDYVIVKGNAAQDDGLDVDMGPMDGAWWEVPLPPCPDCGGKVVRYEACCGPATRRCAACGSVFNVCSRADHCHLIREQFHSAYAQ